MKRLFYSFVIGWAIGVAVFILSTLVSHAGTRTDLRAYTAQISVVGAGSGTGFAIQTPKGPYVLTNAHVCHLSATKKYRIVFDRGIVADGTQYAIDANKDLCLIAVRGLTFGLPLADGFVDGEAAYTAGHPHGGVYAERQGVYGEIVEFPIVLWDDLLILAVRREFHGKVVGGQSGSPVVNVGGEVIGVICCSDERDDMGSFVMFSDVQDFITRGAWL